MSKAVVIKPVLWRWLSRALLDWAIIAACFAIVYGAWTRDYAVFPAVLLVCLVCVVIIGARQHALAILGHDGAHYLATDNRVINNFLTGLLCFWPLGFAINGYRRFHFKHHVAVGTDEDPELIHKNNRWIGQWQMPLQPWKLALQILLDCVGGATPHLGMAAYLTRPTTFVDQLGPALTIGGSIALFWWLGYLWVPLLWFGSLWTTFFIIFRMRLWTEHVGTDTTHRFTTTWWQRFIFLPHNTWCHWEHHESPAVPCWALPSLRAQVPPKGLGEMLYDLTQNKVSHEASEPHAQ